MIKSYFELGIIALLPSIIAGILTFAKIKTRRKKSNFWIEQIIIGIIFGLIAVLGTEFGVPINGAQVNCRDAAVLTAGLFFGAPSGIIAGLIGGIERWVAVAWGIGTFTRVACTVSTILAGFYAAFLRKFMFENKKPGAFMSLAVGIVMEVIHMTMVFVTNMDNQAKAITVVKSCSAIMISANGIAVLLSALLIILVSGKPLINTKGKARVSQTIQRGLLVAVILAFIATTSFVFVFQDTMSTDQTNSLLTLAIDETAADIKDESNSNLLNLAHSINKSLKTRDIQSTLDEYDVTEIQIVNKEGIVVDSSEKSYIGFDVSKSKQSSEFLCLLDNKTEFVQEYGPISHDRATSRKYAGVRTNDGFIIVGYDGDTLQKNVDTQVVDITKNRHVGSTGYILILDSQLNVISSPSSFNLKNFSRSDERIELPDTDVTFQMTVEGTPCFCRYSLSEGYYIFSILPEAEALQSKTVGVYINMYMQIIVYAVLFVLIYMLIKKVVVNQIKKINSSLAKITEGNLEEVVDVRTNEEFESLSDDINSTVDTLKKYIAEASARIDKELEFAKNIQKSALPSNFNTVNNRNEIEIFASMDPAKEVGGDFYDYYFTGKHRLNFLIADVSGKGIPAAMFMMRAKTELKSLSEASLPINEVFTQGNNNLCEGNEAGMFVTAWQGRLDLKTGVVSFANAGHNPPIIRRNGGKFEILKCRAGFVLAGMDGVIYKEQEIKLEPGDEIYLYTDGVTEATNAQEELYGDDRLLAALNSKDFDSIEDLCKFVKSDVDRFVGDAPQFDDITMIALRFKGYSEC